MASLYATADVFVSPRGPRAEVHRVATRWAVSQHVVLCCSMLPCVATRCPARRHATLRRGLVAAVAAEACASGAPSHVARCVSPCLLAVGTLDPLPRRCPTAGTPLARRVRQVLPFRGADWALPLMESMAAGVPVITTRYSSRCPSSPRSFGVGSLLRSVLFACNRWGTGGGTGWTISQTRLHSSSTSHWCRSRDRMRPCQCHSRDRMRPC